MFKSFQDLFHDADTVTVQIRVRPGASQTKLRGVLQDGSIKVDIAAPPEDGKANIELIRFLADECEVPRGQVEILSGETGRVKIVRIMR